MVAPPTWIKKQEVTIPPLYTWTEVGHSTTARSNVEGGRTELKAKKLTSYLDSLEVVVASHPS